MKSEQTPILLFLVILASIVLIYISVDAFIFCVQVCILIGLFVCYITPKKFLLLGGLYCFAWYIAGFVLFSMGNPGGGAVVMIIIVGYLVQLIVNEALQAL